MNIGSLSSLQCSLWCSQYNVISILSQLSHFHTFLKYLTMSLVFKHRSCPIILKETLHGLYNFMVQRVCTPSGNTINIWWCGSVPPGKIKPVIHNCGANKKWRRNVNHFLTSALWLIIPLILCIYLYLNSPLQTLFTPKLILHYHYIICIIYSTGLQFILVKKKNLRSLYITYLYYIC